MKFKFGVVGYNALILRVATAFTAMDHNIVLADMEVRDNFIEFPAEGLWRGLAAINAIAEYLKDSDPGFSPARTKIWIDDEDLDIFLLEKLQTAEKAISGAVRLLKQGRSKKPGTSHAKAKAARESLERTLRDLQLT